MNFISIPPHFLIPIIISVILLIIILIRRKVLFDKRKWLWTSATVFLCTYLFILVTTLYLSKHYQLELQKFDLDGNGSFSIDERTPEQQRAMRKVIGDTARNFSFITGLILAFIIASLTFIFGKVYELIRKNVLVKRK